MCNTELLQKYVILALSQKTPGTSPPFFPESGFLPKVVWELGMDSESKDHRQHKLVMGWTRATHQSLFHNYVSHIRASCY